MSKSQRLAINRRQGKHPFCLEENALFVSGKNSLKNIEREKQNVEGEKIEKI